MDFEERIIPTLTGEAGRQFLERIRASEKAIEGREPADHTKEREAMIAIMKKAKL